MQPGKLDRHGKPRRRRRRPFVGLLGVPFRAPRHLDAFGGKRLDLGMQPEQSDGTQREAHLLARQPGSPRVRQHQAASSSIERQQTFKAFQAHLAVRGVGDARLDPPAAALRLQPAISERHRRKEQQDQPARAGGGDFQPTSHRCP